MPRTRPTITERDHPGIDHEPTHAEEAGNRGGAGALRLRKEAGESDGSGVGIQWHLAQIKYKSLS